MPAGIVSFWLSDILQHEVDRYLKNYLMAIQPITTVARWSAHLKVVPDALSGRRGLNYLRGFAH